MDAVREMNPAPPTASGWRGPAWLLIRAAWTAAALLLAYYLASPNARFFYQGF